MQTVCNLVIIHGVKKQGRWYHTVTRHLSFGRQKVKVNYALGCSIASLDQSGIEEAVCAAQQSDVALLFVGSSSTAFVRHSSAPSTSGEGIDLSGVELTGAQEELIKAVCATGKTGSPSIGNR